MRIKEWFAVLLVSHIVGATPTPTPTPTPTSTPTPTPTPTPAEAVLPPATASGTLVNQSTAATPATPVTTTTTAATETGSTSQTGTGTRPAPANTSTSTSPPSTSTSLAESSSTSVDNNVTTTPTIPSISNKSSSAEPSTQQLTTTTASSLTSTPTSASASNNSQSSTVSAATHSINGGSTSTPVGNPSATTPTTTTSENRPSSPTTLIPTSAATPTTPTTPTSTTPTSTTPTTPTTPPGPVFLINEFTYSGLFAGGKDFFVEVLKISGPGDSSVSVVVLSSIGGKMRTCEAVIEFDQGWANQTDLQMKKAILKTQSVRNIVFVGLYYNASGLNCSQNEKDIDKLVGMADDMMLVSKAQDIIDSSFLPNSPFRVLVADENKLKNLKKAFSVSRCENKTNDPGAFILSNETPDQNNQCSLKYMETVKMTLDAEDCTNIKDTATETKLRNYIAKKVGNSCACGFSPYLIKKVKFECKCLTYTWSLSAATENQKDKIKSQYDAMIEDMSEGSSKCFGNSTLCIGPVPKDCDHLPPAKKENDNKIKVTIGVVVGCVVIFLVIVAIVIIYIRRKRRGILQFRMTRLDEDDDDLMIGPDTDDFVGGQDASFSNPTYARFK